MSTMSPAEIVSLAAFVIAMCAVIGYGLWVEHKDRDEHGPDAPENGE